ncbi:MAG: hypothetical protein ACTSSR_07995 [Alphaproteobacteria bacterium]
MENSKWAPDATLIDLSLEDDEMQSGEELASGARLLRQSNGTAFVILRVRPDNTPAFKRQMKPAATRLRFRTALLGRP